MAKRQPVLYPVEIIVIPIGNNIIKLHTVYTEPAKSSSRIKKLIIGNNMEMIVRIIPRTIYLQSRESYNLRPREVFFFVIFITNVCHFTFFSRYCKEFIIIYFIHAFHSKCKLDNYEKGTGSNLEVISIHEEIPCDVL